MPLAGTRQPATIEFEEFHKDGASSQKAGGEATRLLGKHQAGNGWLEGGRSSLLESAQEATLLSVAMVCFPRQCNTLAVMRGLSNCAAEVVQVEGHSIEVSANA